VRRIVTSLVPALLLAAGAGLVPHAASASPAPLAKPATRTSHREPPRRLVVRYADSAGATARANALAKVRTHGHTVRVAKTIPGLRADVLAVDDQAAVLRLLRADTAVRYVEPESVRRAFADETPTPEIVEIGADTVHSAPTPDVGAGMEIAVVDSVVDATNDDLSDPGKVTDAGDFTSDQPEDPQDPWQTTDYPCDPIGCPHGTAVAAVAAAQAGDGNMAGVAPGATIRSYNVFRRYHWTDPDTLEEGDDVLTSSGDVAAALVAVKDYAATHPSLVAMNMSYGGPFDSHIERDALAALHAAAPQVTLVAAAGNDGTERANFPAGDPSVLSVGAIGNIPQNLSCSATPSSTWTVTSFSNRADVDVVAPGRCVTSWWAGSLTKVDGTSFAAPMVAGVAALLGAAGVTGDAARAAIVAGATHRSTPDVAYGAGYASAPAALAKATGTDPYTAMFVERGGQVASAVGRRNLEVISVDPDGPTPAVPAVTVQSGYGSRTFGTVTLTPTMRTTFATYATPATNQAGQSFTITADGLAVPFRMLDPGDNDEGQPAADTEQTSVGLTYGSRSAYVRSAAITTGNDLVWTYAFDQHGWDNAAELYLWEPASAGGTADAAFEPLPAYGAQTDAYYLTAGSTQCLNGTCPNGRYLVGWMLFSPDDSSDATSRYALKLEYNGPSATVSGPNLASQVSATGPFTVSWGGTGSVKYDVQYGVRAKVGTSWVVQWKPWLTGTTAHSAVFGAGNSPLALYKGQTYHFQVKAYDSLGNPSLTAGRSTQVPLDDTYFGIGYGGSWARGYSSTRWGGSTRYSGTAGSYATTRSDTSSFTVVGDRCAACGQFRVYVDGALKATVDTRASTTQVRQALWTSNLGAIATHTIKVVVVGTTGRPKVVLDGIGVLR
jgi:hypothetical protein